MYQEAYTCTKKRINVPRSVYMYQEGHTCTKKRVHVPRSAYMHQEAHTCTKKRIHVLGAHTCNKDRHFPKYCTRNTNQHENLKARPALGPTQRLIQRLPVFLREGNAARAPSYSPPTSAEVKNERSCNSTPPIYLHCVDRE